MKITVKKHYLYAVFKCFSPQEKPFTTKSKIALVKHFNQERTYVIDKWFEDGCCIHIHKGEYVMRLEIPVIKAKGIGKGSHFAKKTSSKVKLTKK